MNILSVAYPFAPVKSLSAGGAEQILLSLDKAITRSGNYSIVIAESESAITGELIQGKQKTGSIICQSEKEKKWIEYRELISQVLTDKHIDLIHFHGFDFHSYLPESNIPILVTLHLPISFYDCLSDYQKCFFNFVSHYQYAKYSTLVPDASLIVNGVDIPCTNMISKKSNYVLSLGRICPEKGYHLALDAAKKAHVPLILAGTVYPYKEHIDYFRESIQPRLDMHDYRFVGTVDILQKERLYHSAKCLLVPSLIEETSSLVAMEALAHSTPVIAFRAGALQEIIINGTNGFLVDSVDEMAEAISMAHAIDYRQCCQIAKTKYSVQRMTDEYLSLYKRITIT